MSKKTIVIGSAILLAAIGFGLVLYGTSDRMGVAFQGWKLPVGAGTHVLLGCGLLGISIVFFIAGAFTDD